MTDHAKHEFTQAQMAASGWDYMVRKKDGSLMFYSDHEDVATWIKADIDAGHEVSRILTTQTT
jgi:hypothetical protein